MKLLLAEGMLKCPVTKWRNSKCRIYLQILFLCSSISWRNQCACILYTAFSL